MIQSELINRLMSILKELIAVPDEGALPYQTFQELNINSLVFVQLVVRCEQEFNIEFEDDRMLMEKYPTMEAFLNFVTDKAMV